MVHRERFSWISQMHRDEGESIEGQMQRGQLLVEVSKSSANVRVLEVMSDRRVMHKNRSDKVARNGEDTATILKQQQPTPEAKRHQGGLRLKFVYRSAAQGTQDNAASRVLDTIKGEERGRSCRVVERRAVVELWAEQRDVKHTESVEVSTKVMCSNHTQKLQVEAANHLEVQNMGCPREASIKHYAQEPYPRGEGYILIEECERGMWGTVPSSKNERRGFLRRELETPIV